MNADNRWIVDKLAVEQYKLIFALTESFPKHEQYNLTNQIRRSSGSVGANLREAYRKVVYPYHFNLKLTDSHAENEETGYWLEIVITSGYCSKEQIAEILSVNDQISRLLHYMRKNPDKFRHKS